jgi:hypothetical protein
MGEDIQRRTGKKLSSSAGLEPATPEYRETSKLFNSSVQLPLCYEESDILRFVIMILYIEVKRRRATK